MTINGPIVVFIGHSDIDVEPPAVPKFEMSPFSGLHPEIPPSFTTAPRN